MLPFSLIVGWFLVRWGARIALTVAVCLGVTVCAHAQTGPLCTLQLSFPTASAPLPVTATGGCADATGNITSEVVSWGDVGGPKGQTPIPPDSFATFSVLHTYKSAGMFTVTLTAADDTGAQTALRAAQG